MSSFPAQTSTLVRLLSEVLWKVLWLFYFWPSTHISSSFWNVLLPSSHFLSWPLILNDPLSVTVECKGLEHRDWKQPRDTRILSLTLTGHETVNRSCDCCLPHFPHLWNGHDKQQYLPCSLALRIKWIINTSRIYQIAHLTFPEIEAWSMTPVKLAPLGNLKPRARCLWTPETPPVPNITAHTICLGYT